MGQQRFAGSRQADSAAMPLKQRYPYDRLPIRYTLADR